MQEPVNPPLEYDPKFGTLEEWTRATLKYCEYWQSHLHDFEPCTQHEGCPYCLKCARLREDVAHISEVRVCVL